MSLVPPAVLGAVALALAACSSSTQPGRRPATTFPGTTSTSTSSTSSSTSTTSTTVPGTTTTAAAAGPGRCRTAQLRATAATPGVAAGSVGQTVTLRSTAGAPCTLDGYPGLAMLDARGRPLPTTVRRGSSTSVPARQLTLVTLAPGGTASFDLGYHDQTGFGPAVCPTSSELEVTPPNAYTHLVLADRLSPYGPCGTITVSPVYAGSGH